MAADIVKFAGAWRLVSFERRDQDGQVIFPYGPDATGYIQYSATGYMSVECCDRCCGATALHLGRLSGRL